MASAHQEKNLVLINSIITFPSHTPTIPKIPAKAGGAGIGSRSRLNTPPQIIPVIKAKISNFINIQLRT